MLPPAPAAKSNPKKAPAAKTPKATATKAADPAAAPAAPLAKRPRVSKAKGVSAPAEAADDKNEGEVDEIGAEASDWDLSDD